MTMPRMSKLLHQTKKKSICLKLKARLKEKKMKLLLSRKAPVMKNNRTQTAEKEKKQIHYGIPKSLKNWRRFLPIFAAKQNYPETKPPMIVRKYQDTH